MSNIWLNIVFSRSKTVYGARLVLLSLADRANDSGTCWPSISDISSRTRLSERQVQRALRHLVQSGELEVVEPGGGVRAGSGRQTGKPTVYRLTGRPETVTSTSGFRKRKGDTGVRVSRVETVTFAPQSVTARAQKSDIPSAETVTPMSPEPSAENPHQTLNEPADCNCEVVVGVSAAVSEPEYLLGETDTAHPNEHFVEKHPAETPRPGLPEPSEEQRQYAELTEQINRAQQIEDPAARFATAQAAHADLRAWLAQRPDFAAFVARVEAASENEKAAAQAEEHQKLQRERAALDERLDRCLHTAKALGIDDPFANELRAACRGSNERTGVLENAIADVRANGKVHNPGGYLRQLLKARGVL